MLTLREADPAIADEVVAMIAADRASRLPLDPDAEGSPVTRMLAQDLQEEPYPDAFGPYRRLHKLGEGGMGVVFEAAQDHPRRRVAVKTTARPGSDHPRARLLRAEADALARLLHPAIPQVYSVGEADGRVFVAMELVEGQPLHRWAAGASRRTIVAVLQQAAAGVAHAHGRGLVHRDLKPDNLRVTPGGQVKVLDFGLAVADGGAEGVAGTRGYIAPELMDGGPPTPASDLYALGVTASEVLGAVDDRDLAAILERARAPRAEARYRDAGSLADDLQAWLDRRPVQARRAGWWHRVRLFGRRNGRALAVAAAGTLGASTLVFAGIQLVERHRESEVAADVRRAWEATWTELANDLDIGQDEVATERFMGFVGRPEVQGGPLEAEAWLAWGRLLPEARRERREAFAFAAAVARDRRVETEALTALLEASVLREGPEVIGALLDGLTDLGAAPSEGHVAWQLTRSAQEAPWGLVTPLEGHFWDGAPSGWPPVRLDEGLTVGGEPLWTEPGALCRPARAGGAHWVGCVREDRVSLHRADGEPVMIVEDLVRRLVLAGVETAAGPRVALASGRRVHLVAPDGGRVGVPPIDRYGSEVMALAAVDLDEDGQQELAALLGPWNGYRLVVVGFGPDGAVERVEEVPVGYGERLVALRWQGRPALGVAVFPWHGNPARMKAEPPAVKVVQHGADGLQVLGFPSPWTHGEDHLVPLVAGDFDGDGLDDLAVGARPVGRTWLLRQRADGGVDPLQLPASLPVHAADLDGDGDDELLVVDGRTGRTLVHGRSDGRPLPRREAHGSLPSPPRSLDHRLRSSWVRAHRLTRYGQPVAAGRALASAASATDGQARRDLLKAAVELVGDAAPALRRRLLRDLVRAGDEGAVAEAIEAHLDALDLAGAQALHAWAPGEAGGLTGLEPGPVEAVDLRQAPGEWTVHDPERLGWQPGTGVVLRGYNRGGPIAELGWEVVADRVELELPLDLASLELGGGLTVEVRGDADRLAFLALAAVGGAGQTHLQLHFQGTDRKLSVVPDAARLRVALTRLRGPQGERTHLAARLVAGAWTPTWAEVVPGPLPRSLQLRMGAGGEDSYGAHGELQVHLRALEIRGLRPLPGGRWIRVEDRAAVEARVDAALAAGDADGLVRLLREHEALVVPLLGGLDREALVDTTLRAWLLRDGARLRQPRHLDAPAYLEIAPDRPPTRWLWWLRAERAAAEGRTSEARALLQRALAAAGPEEGALRREAERLGLGVQSSRGERGEGAPGEVADGG